MDMSETWSMQEQSDGDVVSAGAGQEQNDVVVEVSVSDTPRKASRHEGSPKLAPNTNSVVLRLAESVDEEQAVPVQEKNSLRFRAINWTETAPQKLEMTRRHSVPETSPEETSESTAGRRGRPSGARSLSFKGFCDGLTWSGVFAAMLEALAGLVDANSLGSVLPQLAEFGLLSGMTGYFVNQLVAGAVSDLSPHIVSLSWEIMPLLQQAVKQMGPVSEGKDEVFTVLAINSMVPITAGVFMCILGKARLVRTMLYMPAPVLSGIFACVAYSMWALGFDLATNGEVSFEVSEPGTLADLLLPAMWHKWLIALVLGAALFITSLKLPDYCDQCNRS